MTSLEELNNLVQTQKEKINQLERKVIEYQADIIQLEGVLCTRIENLETELTEERTKLHRLLSEEEKRRRLTEDLGSGVTLELVEIPAGRFLMGGVREITLQSFLMGKYPVTQLQWFAIMGNNPSHFKGNNLPVEQITWHEANEFCNKLSEKTGRKYQLPSESQWEYACRAGTTTNYFFGNDEKELEKYAWYVDNSNKQSHPVGEKLPNPWGLYDILGNVWEWCQDDWLDGHNHIPVNGSAYVNNNTTKCIRGGSWASNANIRRSDHRDRYDATARSSYLGLRVVMLPGAL